VSVLRFYDVISKKWSCAVCAIRLATVKDMYLANPFWFYHVTNTEGIKCSAI